MTSLPDEDSSATVRHRVSASESIRPVTCNTYIGAMNAFCVWLHEEGHAAERVKLPKLRVERRILALLDDTQMRVLIGYKPKTFRPGATPSRGSARCSIPGLRISEALHLRHARHRCGQSDSQGIRQGPEGAAGAVLAGIAKAPVSFPAAESKEGHSQRFRVRRVRRCRWEKRNSTTSLHLLRRSSDSPDSAGTAFATHSPRTTFATVGDIVRLSMVLGHTQITTTQRYLHLLTEDLSASHQRVSILNRLT